MGHGTSKKEKPGLGLEPRISTCCLFNRKVTPYHWANPADCCAAPHIHTESHKGTKVGSHRQAHGAIETLSRLDRSLSLASSEFSVTKSCRTGSQTHRAGNFDAGSPAAYPERIGRTRALEANCTGVVMRLVQHRHCKISSMPSRSYRRPYNDAPTINPHPTTCLTPGTLPSTAYSSSVA